MNRVKSTKVIPYTCRIQSKPRSFYEQFSIIIAGLDNVEARRWLNKTVHDMCQFDDEGNIVEGTQRYLIDGGTENFSGQCMVIKPFETNCYECILATIPKATTFNSCTIANTPRIPEHCIQYVYEIEWQKAYPDTKVDSDDPKHI
jgi:ubiquitin-activating enzyme E1 C